MTIYPRPRMRSFIVGDDGDGDAVPAPALPFTGFVAGGWPDALLGVTEGEIGLGERMKSFTRWLDFGMQRPSWP